MTADETREQKLTEERSEFLVACEAIAVRTPEEYEAAGEMLVHGKSLLKKIREYFEGLKKPAHDAWKQIVAREKSEIAKIEPGLDALNAAMDTWDAEQLRLRLEEEARLRRAEEERRLEAAAKLEEAGMKESAKEALAAAVDAEETRVAPAPTPVSVAPKVSGMAVNRYPDFEIVDPLAIARDYLMPNERKIREVVKRHGEGAVEIVGPGIRVFERTTRRSTGR